MISSSPRRRQRRKERRVPRCRKAATKILSAAPTSLVWSLFALFPADFEQRRRRRGRLFRYTPAEQSRRTREDKKRPRRLAALFFAAKQQPVRQLLPVSAPALVAPPPLANWVLPGGAGLIRSWRWRGRGRLLFGKKKWWPRAWCGPLLPSMSASEEIFLLCVCATYFWAYVFIY